MEIQMYRLIVLAIAIGAAVCPGAPAMARVVEAGDAAAVALAAPAVVSISVWQETASDQPGGPPRRIKAYGSGFIVDPSGIIVTNKHVINGAFDVKATLNDGTLVSARLIAASALLDIAVLKVDVDHKLPSLEWGNSDDLQAGDPVLTVGNGLGWGTSVSAGIVSGLNRNLMDSPFDSYIQTDATINHGTPAVRWSVGKGKSSASTRHCSIPWVKVSSELASPSRPARRNTWPSYCLIPTIPRQAGWASSFRT
jgi:S1-C subfamily serine protease